MKTLHAIKKLAPAKVRSFIKDMLGISSLDETVNAKIDSLQQTITALGHRNDTTALGIQGRIERIEAAMVRSGALRPEIETARGYFEHLSYAENLFKTRGWIMLPDRELDSAALYVGGVKVAEAQLSERGDRQEAFPFISHARHSGFAFSVPLTLGEKPVISEVCVVGMSHGAEVARMAGWYHPDMYSCYSIPPPAIVKRSGSILGDLFLLWGLKSYMEFWTVVSKHQDLHRIRTMLEWGCGGGRITRFFLKLSDIPCVHGCDIDSEAIAWCRDNLKPGIFSALKFDPPTPYADSTFDLIVSYSVLTHLAKEMQLAWLEELRRILAPGGLLLATVHGEFAARFVFAGRQAVDLLAGGIYDDMVDHGLDDIAPPGYYRGVFQKKAYSLETYARWFEIIDYIERGALNYQDIVVMRKK